MAEAPYCPVCASLAREENIASPAELWRMVERIKAAVAADQLVEIASPEHAAVGSSEPILETLGPHRTLPDWLQLRFACTGCGRSFELSCETYHGSGGWWRAPREEP